MRAPARRRAGDIRCADRDLLDVLEELEHSKNYSAWILELIGPHINGRILEVGAGRSTYSTYFADHGHLTARAVPTEPGAA